MYTVNLWRVHTGVINFMIFDLTFIFLLVITAFFAYATGRDAKLFSFVANVFIMVLCIAVLTIRLTP